MSCYCIGSSFENQADLSSCLQTVDVSLSLSVTGTNEDIHFILNPNGWKKYLRIFCYAWKKHQAGISPFNVSNCSPFFIDRCDLQHGKESINIWLFLSFSKKYYTEKFLTPKSHEKTTSDLIFFPLFNWITLLNSLQGCRNWWCWWCYSTTNICQFSVCKPWLAPPIFWQVRYLGL